MKGQRQFSEKDVGDVCPLEKRELKNFYYDLGFVPDATYLVSKSCRLQCKMDYFWANVRCIYYLIRVAETTPQESYHIDNYFTINLSQSKLFKDFTTDQQELEYQIKKLKAALE